MTSSCTFSMMLSIMLLALMMLEPTGSQSPKNNEKDVFRVRRSVSSSEGNSTTAVSNNSSSGSSNNISATTQAPETATKNSSHTQGLPATTKPNSVTGNITDNITDSIQPKHGATAGPRSGESDRNTPTSTVKQPSISTSKVSSGVTSPSGPSHNASSNSTTQSTSQSTHVKPHTPTTQPTPSVTNSSSNKSLVFPVTSSVPTNASSVPEHTSVTGEPANSHNRTTTDHMPTTTNGSSTSAIGLHPRPHPKSTSAAVTTTTSKPSPPPTPKKSDCPLQTASPGHKHQGLVSNCLIAIASLAGLATFFMVFSIVLCTKLSSAKHRYRLRSIGGEGTEMVCISSLLPDGDGPVMRPKMPKSNGALLPVMDADGDSDCGDNLTLNSFLPDGERV